MRGSNAVAPLRAEAQGQSSCSAAETCKLYDYPLHKTRIAANRSRMFVGLLDMSLLDILIKERQSALKSLQGEMERRRGRLCNARALHCCVYCCEKEPGAQWVGGLNLRLKKGPGALLPSFSPPVRTHSSFSLHSLTIPTPSLSLHHAFLCICPLLFDRYLLGHLGCTSIPCRYPHNRGRCCMHS